MTETKTTYRPELSLENSLFDERIEVFVTKQSFTKRHFIATTSDPLFSDTNICVIHSKLKPMNTHGYKISTKQSLITTHGWLDSSHEQLELTHEQLELTHERLEPTHEWLEPTHEWLEPSQEWLEPAQEQLEPSQERLDSSHGWLEYSKDRLKASCCCITMDYDLFKLNINSKN